MNSQFEQLMQMAIAVAKLGNRRMARTILVDVVRRELGNVRTWLVGPLLRRGLAHTKGSSFPVTPIIRSTKGLTRRRNQCYWDGIIILS